MTGDKSSTPDGEQKWQHFMGASVGDIDVSEDESTLVCSTYAGFISIIRLDNGKSEDYEIGNGGHTETRRWIFWKNEEKGLIRFGAEVIAIIFY